MKYRAAQRLKKDEERVLAELAGLDAEAENHRKKIADEDAEMAKLDARITETSTQAGRFRECIGETHREAEEDVRKIRERERITVEQYEARIRECEEQVGGLTKIRSGASARRSTAESGLAAIDPRRESLQRELAKIKEKLPEADAKIAQVEAAKKPCDRCKGQKFVPGGENVIPCPECQAPKVVKLVDDKPRNGLTPEQARRMFNFGGSVSRHGPRPEDMPLPPLVQRRTATVRVKPAPAAPAPSAMPAAPEGVSATPAPALPEPKPTAP